ncbi:Calmodulin-binding protein 60 A [Camellia lanceoleosa]|uniref:Calmodulin-binding protein 60 A n=1 Tax=Camellia lanceoleosa TaxID=1840588 RepID=A0ACC0HYK2_9ERIC|nr:Calmodulin-binding protein 60 A [Camellia lanceoleosa]
MSQVRQLAKSNSGSQTTSNIISTSDDEEGSTLLSALRNGDLNTIKHVIQPIIEPLIRRIVKEEFESMQERILTSMNQNSGNKIHCSEPRSLQLRFLNKLSPLLLTGSQVKGENCSSVRIDLVDVITKQVVKFGPEASAKVEIVVLRVDPDKDEEHEWTREEFNLKIVKETKENESILTRNAFLNLKEGIGSLDEISFAHRARWMKKHEFRLGARIVNKFDRTRVREAKSEPFFLEDCRNKLYKKHYPPSLTDKVWRLENIGKGGCIDKRLSKENIITVEDFLKKFFIDCQGLRDILGSAMPDKKLDVTVNHALACKLDERYLYPPPSSQQKTRIVFNAVGQVLGVYSECHYTPIDDLSETKKADAQKLVVSAFEHWGQVVPYDDNSLLRNALSPSNLTWPQSPSGTNVCTSHMIAEYDHTQPSTSQAPVFQYEPSGAPHQAPNQMWDLGSMIRDIVQDFEESQAVAIDEAQSRKWVQMFIVLKFSVRMITKLSGHVRKKQRLH